jgi:hypothetical protein
LNWSWLQQLLGVSGEEIPADADVRLTWTNLPQSWRVFLVLFAVAALVYGVIALYRRDALRLAAGQRRLLAGLRIAVLLLLALIALGPALSFTQRRVLQPVIVLLRDSSQSMAIADRHADAAQRAAIARATGRSETAVAAEPPTRAAIVNELLQRDAQALLSRLEQRGQLRVLDFAESVRAVDVRTREQSGESREQPDSNDGSPLATDHSSLTPLAPVGPGTNLHLALSEALAERLTAAVVLLTDGQHTDRGTGQDDLLGLARRARSQGVPLLVVGLGDPNRPRNLQVSDVYADAQVWKDDPFELQALLRSEGFGGESVKVDLVEQQLDESSDRAASEQVLESRDVALPPEGGQVRLSFTHTPRAAGRFAYTVRVQPLAGEAATDDNAPPAPAEVKVIDDKARVLLVAGSSHWDYRFVRQLLEREKSVELSCWLQTLDEDRAQEGDKSITRLPRTKEEIFEYDVVLLLDPDPREFDEQWLTVLTEFVSEHAGGLLYMAGPVFTSQFVTGPRTGDIRNLLPVRFGDVAATDVASLLESHDREWSLGIVESGLDHPLMRFHPESHRALDVWKTMPGIVWSFPVRDAVPTASVLLEHSDPALTQIAGPRPLLVTGHFGAGRTAFLGFDGTWRWRRAGRNAEFFNRFWLQATRYLVEGRAVEGKRRGTIETDRTRYEVGDRITVVARLADAQFKPLEAPEMPAHLEVPGRDPLPVTLRPVPQQPGRFEAVVTAQHTGRHVLRVDFGGAGGTATPKVETTFSVSPPSVESARTWQDQPLLSELAAASGGRYFGLEEVSGLADSIPDKQQTLLVQGKPIPLWDTSRVLLLVVILLTLEWALRKRFKLL